MNYLLKEITKEDLSDYMYVSTKAWNETYPGIGPDEFLKKILAERDQKVAWLKNNFDQTKLEEPDYKRFLLYVNNEPSGICGVCKSRDEKHPTSGEICTLYLLDKVKKQGYGQLLFTKAKEELKKQGFHNMVIYCLKDNPTTNFYVHMGGKLSGTIEKNIGGKNLIENIYYFDNI